MKYRKFRATIASAVVAMSFAAAAPSHAEPLAGWVVIGTGAFAAPSVDLDVVADVIDIVNGIAADKACTPRSKSVTPGDLSWTMWQNQSTGAIAFEWHGSGAATVSDDCPQSLDVVVDLTDYAPSGNPPAELADSPGHGVDSSPSGGQFSAAAPADNWVLYYDPARLYQRGSSVVEIRVTASYYNKKAKATVPLGCAMTHTAITPWPTGPDGTTGPAEEC